MKLHIENFHITLTNQQPPAGLIAALAIATAGATGNKPAAADIPAIGEKWPGIEAIYAGTALSIDENSIVHLILWLDDQKRDMSYEDAVKHAESVNPDMNSHLPTRHQGITLFERLQSSFNQDYYHWLLTKTPSGKAAFLQFFLYGLQSSTGLSAECRVRAVSEIRL